VDQPALEVDVPPLERQDLAAPGRRIEGGREHRVEARLSFLREPEQHADLGESERVDVRHRCDGRRSSTPVAPIGPANG